MTTSKESQEPSEVPCLCLPKQTPSSNWSEETGSSLSASGKALQWGRLTWFEVHPQGLHGEGETCPLASTSALCPYTYTHLLATTPGSRERHLLDASETFREGLTAVCLELFCTLERKATAELIMWAYSWSKGLEEEKRREGGTQIEKFSTKYLPHQIQKHLKKPCASSSCFPFRDAGMDGSTHAASMQSLAHIRHQDRNQASTSTDAEKAINKVQRCFIIKDLKELGRIGLYLVQVCMTKS